MYILITRDRLLLIMQGRWLSCTIVSYRKGSVWRVVFWLVYYAVFIFLSIWLLRSIASYLAIQNNMEFSVVPLPLDLL